MDAEKKSGFRTGVVRKKTSEEEKRMLIIIDAGLACAIFFLMVLFGATGVEAMGAWVSENFIWIIVLLIVISIVKSAIFLNESSCSFAEAVVCAVCDGIRLIPVGYFLWVFFQGFAELAHEGAIRMLFGVLLNFLGAAIVIVPEGAIFLITEYLCSALIEDNGSCGTYIIYSVLGVGAQMLLFLVFGVL